MTTKHSDTSPFSEAVKTLRGLISAYLDRKTVDIDHTLVLNSLHEQVVISGSYVSSIVLANLVALMGLLTNSVAVVIGAMLISPLMGPIFSLGMAFCMADLRLARRAVRTIVGSILLTVIVAALFTVISPLKGVTQEILARTRPNVYDLLIAVFAGTAGALALCTRKNYLFTTTGVAVATAVIPPLSVVGYGIGTLQFRLAVGGFLLFFTNLVAIVISSDIVFYLARFRASMVTEARYPTRKRLQILGVVLAVISVPLVTTLVSDIRKVKLTNRVERTLQSFLALQDHSRLTGFSIRKDKDDKTVVAATINTVKGLDQKLQQQLEAELNQETGRTLKLDLEQIIVTAGAFEAQKANPTTVEQVAQKPRDTIGTLRVKSLQQAQEGCAEATAYLAPYPITSCGVRFDESSQQPVLLVTVARDRAITAQESAWLQVALSKRLQNAVKVEVKVVPLLDRIRFAADGQLAAETIKQLAVLKGIQASLPDARFEIVVPSGALSRKHALLLKQYLLQQLAVQPSHIIEKRDAASALRLLVREPG